MTRLPFLLALVCAFVAGALLPCAEPVHAQIPPAEAALGRESDVLALSCRIEQEETYDFHGTEFYALKCNDIGRAVISVDSHLMLARWLRGHNRQTATMEWRPRDLARLDR